jgi:multidrug efflux pump subunit AcrB
MPRGPDPRATQTVDPQHPTLASLANFELDSDVGGVVRINGQRVNEVKAYIRAGVLPAVVMDEFKQRLSAADFVLPSGYALEFGGETEQRSNAVNALIANAIVLFALMTLTLVAAFRSFRCALIIAVVGGLSAGLGPLALSVFGFPLGFMAIVGTMGLVGVAINDSIVVLAAIRANPASSQSPLEMTKVVSGCTRHIIATTLTTIVGFLPLILGGGGFWPPMALTIAGGVGGATLLALYFVPSFYLLVNTNGPANHR